MEDKGAVVFKIVDSIATPSEEVVDDYGFSFLGHVQFGIPVMYARGVTVGS